MKNILKFGLLACLAAAFVFAGCKKDDDDSKFAVTLSANNAEWGTVAGGGEFAEGTEIQIMAIANSGYHFEKWSDDDTNNPRTITVTKNIALIAIFAEGNGGGTVNGGDNGNNNNSGNNGTATGDILPKKVTKIVLASEDHGKTYTETLLFDSEGRITKDYYDSGTKDWYEYQYDDNKVTCTKYEDGKVDRTGTCILNIQNGRVSSIAYDDGSTVFNYTSDGYLDSYEGVKFNYENGLLMTYGEYDNERASENWERKITYGTALNNLSVDLVLFFIDDDLWISSLFGNRVKLLPSIKEEIGYNEDDYRKEEYAYEYNGEYITKITVKETRNGKVSTDILEIFY